MGLKFGMDIGIASVGWAVVNDDMDVLESASYLFDTADSSKNATRRERRGTKRLARRRVHRVERFNKLWNESIGEPIISINVDPLILRNQGLSSKLNLEEIYIVLRYMLKHRGISYLDDAEDESVTGDFKTALSNNSKKLKSLLPCQIQLEKQQKYGKFRGDDIVIDAVTGEHTPISNVFTKSSYKKEVESTLEKQQEYHVSITDDFIDSYMEIFDSKREYYIGPGNENSRTDYGVYTTNIDKVTGRYITDDNLFEKLIGTCTIYKDELRASAASYTAQEFNFLNDLNNLTVNNRKLTKKEKLKIKNIIFSQKSISVNGSMRKFIKQAINAEIEQFSGTRVDKKDKEIYHTFEIYRKLKKFLDDIEFDLSSLTVEEYDEIAKIMTINTDRDSILKGFESNGLNLDNEVQDELIKFRKKNSSMFSKWHSFSIKVMKEIMNDLYERPVNQMVILSERGLLKTDIEKYKECREIPTDLVTEDIFNPVVKKAVAQSIKILNALIKKYGFPEDIIIEMARDKNADEKRKRINKYQGSLEAELKNIVDLINDQYDILVTDEHYYNHKKLKTKLRLWHEQDGVCSYSGKIINIKELIYDIKAFEIDHIIPLSISFDDSRSNKVLVYRNENQLKGNRTPYMYLSNLSRDWNYEKYKDFVLSLYGKKKIGKSKKNNLLFMDNITKEEVVKGFINRNLNDTRYASRVVLNTVQGYMKANETGTKVKVVRGSFTAQLRKKLQLDKNRDESYAHHAVDAIIMCYSIMGLDKYKISSQQIIDYETGEIFDKDKFNAMDDEKEYLDKMFYEKITLIKHNIAKAEKSIKFSYKVDKKINRQLSNETIYGVKEKPDGTKQKISKIGDIYTKEGWEKFQKKITPNKKGETKVEDFLMYHYDRRTFDKLLKVVDTYKDKKNPFLAYKEDAGEPIRKYSKKDNGPFIKSLKYYDGAVGSCIDISHKYGHEKGSKKVILDSLNPYRTDVYFKPSDGTYHLAGIKYANFKFEKGTGDYKLDVKSYNQILIDEKILNEGQVLKDIEEDMSSYGCEFMFSLYKHDFILYEKNGEEKLERFLSRTQPAKKNYIETKPIYANKFEKQNQFGLTKTKKIIKVNTDILGNKHYTKKEKFSLGVKLDK